MLRPLLSPGRAPGFRAIAAPLLAVCGLAAASESACAGTDPHTVDAAAVAATFEEHCFGCHGYGSEEGGLNFDSLAAGKYGDDTEAKWEAVWKNLRSQTMPPSDEERPPVDWQTASIDWIGSEVFRLDPNHVDPGRVVLRRLNRSEYQETIRQLLDVSFDVDEEFPADDTGYGFDTIGEVLTVSPMLLEKYLAAANTVVDEFMPYDGPKPPEQHLWGNGFRRDHIKGDKFERTELHQPVTVVRPLEIEQAGTYRLSLEHAIDNAWVPTEQSAELVWSVRPAGEDGLPGEKEIELHRSVVSHDTADDSRPVAHTAEIALPKGDAVFVCRLLPKNTDTTATVENKEPQRYQFRIHRVTVAGPTDGPDLEYPEPAKWRLEQGPPPPNATPEQLRAHLRKEIETFALKAYRRPIDEPTLDRLTGYAFERSTEEGKRYEDGLAVAVKAILSSPRFLFRTDVPVMSQAEDGVAPIDDYSLATRLSYFLWSRSPDAELLQHAKDGSLREHLDEQVDRLIDSRWHFPTGVENFVGQWLQTRDVHEIDIDVRYVTRSRRTSDAYKIFNWKHREALAAEVEAMFRYVIAENRPVEEFLNADYTFLNRDSAELYGLPKSLKDVDGKPLSRGEPTRVDLPKNAHRGGVLRSGAMLLVTSNATRTSPVKRGLFILENILGTPAPPAPPDVPELESAKNELGPDATLRQTLEAHRSKAECAGCHSRMDPLGLALENYDAIGRYRERTLEMPKTRWTAFEPSHAIDPSGTLMTGESFADADELVDILAKDRRHDYYRCLTEKLLTYALGRGLTYRDGPAVDAIVEQTMQAGGGGRDLIKAIVRSKPFTHMRVDAPSDSVAAAD